MGNHWAARKFSIVAFVVDIEKFEIGAPHRLFTSNPPNSWMLSWVDQGLGDSKQSTNKRRKRSLSTMCHSLMIPLRLSQILILLFVFIAFEIGAS